MDHCLRCLFQPSFEGCPVWFTFAIYSSMVQGCVDTASARGTHPHGFGSQRSSGLERPGVFTGDCGQWRSMAMRRVDTNLTPMGSQMGTILHFLLHRGNPLSYVHYGFTCISEHPSTWYAPVFG
ncbi:hypothetical protein Aduo_002487 [Ancylostoma duodenale]